MMPELKAGLLAGTFGVQDLVTIGSRVSPPISSSMSSWLTSLQIQSGAAASRADDIKGLKSAVLDWITNSREGLVPPLPRNNLVMRGYNHHATGAQLCPAGLSYDA